MKYYIVYKYKGKENDKHISGTGCSYVTRGEPLKSMSQIAKLIDELKKESGYRNLVLINWIEIDEF